jgi:hypothetical protein
MATTTNYGWVTPDDTALVKDGAAAIRTLGTSIDTTTFNNASAAIAKTIVDAKGDIIAATAADTVSRLAVGANDTVLTADSTAGTGLKWATPAAGGMTLLSTTTLSSTSTTISSISGAYNNLQIVISGSVGAGLPAIRPNGSATITYAATQKNSTNGNINGGVWYFTEFGQTNNAGVITIYNYASATYRKPFFAMSGYDASGSFEAKSFHGYINTTSAITSIEINGSGDTFTGGQVLIYGVK